mgnify:FL=1
MHILVLASGSGGHVYPCLSFIKHAKDYKITYLTIKNGFENKLVSNSSSYLDIKNQFKSYIKDINEYKKLKSEIKRNEELIKNIDVILCFGGFVSFVGAIISKTYHKPLYLHEQNKSIGDANKFALMYAKKIFTSFKETKSLLFKNKITYVGNPRVDDILKIQSTHPYFNILLFAGSLSSSTLNKVYEELIQKQFDHRLRFYVITGKKAYEKFNKYKNAQVEVIEYQKDMLELMAKIDLVIMRAGATSIGEIIAFNIPAIMIPSQFVKHNHQYENAKVLSDKNAGIVFLEKDVTANKLKEKIDNLFYGKYEYALIKKNLRYFEKKDVTKEMLKEIENG